ncbi:MAG: hypothetical protein HC852_02830 [Acaryochloridaceae cyanobacterium RU_4_10]|nr:hypothetical protein [Acaryochloridaceae cyanobacterium RU_4_10]
MVLAANDVRREAHTKIRNRILVAFEKEFGIVQTTGLHIDLGNHADTWLSIPPDFPKRELSDERIVAALEKEFGIKFKQGAFIRFEDDQQGADVWLPIPSDFLKGELSEDEIQAVAGRSIMIRWDILPGKSLHELNLGELLCIGFGTFPSKFF